MDRPKDDTANDPIGDEADDDGLDGLDADADMGISGTYSSWPDMLAELRSQRDIECEPGDDTTIELHQEPCEGPANCTCEPVRLSAWDDAGIEAALRAMDEVN